MERRFYDTSIWSDSSFRKLKPSLKTLYFYIWSKCDPCGHYVLDADYLRIDTGEKYTKEDFSKLFSFGLTSAGIEKFFFENYISVNYGELKENYNPHKPAFRALKKNNIQYDSSLNQACFKLEEEGVYEEEGEEEEEEGPKKTKSVKVKPEFIPPTLEEFNSYCIENGYGNISERVYKGYSEAVPPWHDTKGNKILSWKSKLQNVWFRPDNKDTVISSGPIFHNKNPQKLDLIDKAMLVRIETQKMIEDEFRNS